MDNTQKPFSPSASVSLAPSKEPDSSRASGALARGGIFSLLGRCLEYEVDAEFLSLLRGVLVDAFADAGIVMGKKFMSADAAELLEELAEEYTGLFVAPGGVLPYASVFETGKFFQEQSDRAAASYREAGLEYKALYSGEFPDHLGTMLSFIGRLSEAEAEALNAGDTQRADILRDRWQKFILGEVGSWSIGWCRRAGECARHEFYIKILKLAEVVLWDEISDLADRKTLKKLKELNAREPVRLDYDADFRKASGL